MRRARKSPVVVRQPAPTPDFREGGYSDQRSLPLDASSTPAQSVQAAISRRLWFCVYLPELPLEACGPANGARVVVEEQQGMHRVLLADRKARAAGIMPGQTANAALALLASLDIAERSRLAEQQTLEQVAAWLESFSSMVSIAGSDVLLLEVAGSLRLFGGLKALRRQIATELGEQGFAASLAIAPTPLAATWLARGKRRACVRAAANLNSALRTLPLYCLGWPDATVESLGSMGVENVGDCLRLPREGFARRVGPERLIELDRALGRVPDPRSSWRAPETFCADFEMTEEQSERELLLKICRELLLELEQFLLARQLGTQHICFSFFHLRDPATQLTLGCARAERRAAHWFELLKIRFERLSLPEGVIAVRLYGGHMQAMDVVSGYLGFHQESRTRRVGYSMLQLAERLTARIGRQSVQGVTTVAEHRPQYAWRTEDILGDDVTNGQVQVPNALRRPLWMLPEPMALSAEQGYPLHHGPLTLVEGPERLETGWWDAGGIARDYYLAVNPQGVQLWVFRDRKRDAGWHLHGIFG